MTFYHLRQFFFAVLTLWCVLLPPASLALPNPDVDSEYLFRLFGSGGFFSTTSNYDTTGGSYTSLLPGRKYELFSGDFGLEYRITPDFFVMGSLGLARAESNDGTYNRVKTEPTDALLGIRYILSQDPLIVVPEIWFSYPFNSYNNQTDDVLTGEGVMRGYGGSYIAFPFSTLYVYSNLGFLYQSEGRASHGLYSLGVGWKPEFFSLGVEVHGTKVFLDDDYKHNRAVRDNVTYRVDGGSFKFGSVNPEEFYVAARGDLRWAPTWSIGASYEQTVNGTASANGYQVMGHLEYRWIESGRENDTGATRVTSPPEETKQFEPEQPDYDQTLFSNPKPKLKMKKTVRKSEKVKVKPVDVDKALEDVQKSLEKQK